MERLRPRGSLGIFNINTHRIVFTFIGLCHELIINKNPNVGHLAASSIQCGSCFGQLIVKRYFVNIEAVPWAIWRHRCNRILLQSKILRSIAASEEL